MRKATCVRSFTLLPFLVIFFTACNEVVSGEKKSPDSLTIKDKPVKKDEPVKKELDTAAYNKIMRALANGDTTGKWPVRAPYPLDGAVLPFHRVVAFYGNLYSKRMGILGEIPKDEMFKKLKGEVARWQAADSSIPVIPALHYVAVTAQGAAGRDGKYRLRMPFHQIDTIVRWSRQINALAFLDIQVAHSTVKAEMVPLESYLKMPDVHFGIDPEFSMKGGGVPGSKIGTFTADDINTAIDYLAEIVRKNNIPPKILVIHRFTEGMVKGAQSIKKVPEVQVVMDMDGWGGKILKKSSYLRYIYKEPVQFTGFKIFYKNDTKTGSDQLFTPAELLRFVPKPIYIQYQ